MQSHFLHHYSPRKKVHVECLTLPKAIQTLKVISDPLGYHLRGFKIFQKILKGSMNRVGFLIIIPLNKENILRRTSDFEWDFFIPPCKT